MLINPSSPVTIMSPHPCHACHLPQVSPTIATFCSSRAPSSPHLFPLPLSNVCHGREFLTCGSFSFWNFFVLKATTVENGRATTSPPLPPHLPLYIDLGRATLHLTPATSINAQVEITSNWEHSYKFPSNHMGRLDSKKVFVICSMCHFEVRGYFNKDVKNFVHLH